MSFFKKENGVVRVAFIVPSIHFANEVCDICEKSCVLKSESMTWKSEHSWRPIVNENFTQFEATIWAKHDTQSQWSKISKIIILA